MSGSRDALVTGLPRLLRAGLFVACALALSLAAHVAGGAAAPPLAVLVMAGLLMLPVSSLLAGRRRRWPGLTAGLLATQAALHQGFMTFSAGPGCHLTGSAPDASGAGHAGMVMEAAPVTCAPPPLAAVGHEPGPGMWMVACHIVAAAALAVLLSQGERVLWLVADWLMPKLPAVAAPPQVLALSAPVEPGPGTTPRPPLLAGGTGRRGPPIAIGVPA